jgi:hypothetical protein
MHLPNQKSINIDGIDMKELYIDGTLIWKSGYTNLVPLSTEADGKTIYNNGLGYKNGYRIRSGGAEVEYSGTSCTGYILAKAGYVVRLSGVVLDDNIMNSINVYGANHNTLGQIASNYPDGGYGFFNTTWREYGWGNAKGVKEEKIGVFTWTIPPDETIAYIRVTGNTNEQGSKLIVTVNEEIS